MSGGYVTGGLLSAIGIIFLWVGWKAAKKDRLHETGVEGSASILSITQTGAYLNRNPYVLFDFEVEVPGHPAYEVKHREIVPLVLLGRLAPGTSLPVRVDRDNPSHLIVEWERA